MAPFIDGGRTVDRTNWSNTVISYYPFGGAIALALDLTLRDRATAAVSLDDFMRAMWRKYGKPGGGREGYVDRPYTIDDAEATLAEVSGDRAVRARLLRALHPGPRGRRLRAAAGARRLHRAQASTPAARGSAISASSRAAARGSRRWWRRPGRSTPPGIDQDDELQQIDGQRISRPERRRRRARAARSRATSSRSCSSIAPAPRGRAA